MVQLTCQFCFYIKSSLIDPFTVNVHKVATINQYQWKELLKITPSTIFDGKRLKTCEYTAY